MEKIYSLRRQPRPNSLLADFDLNTEAAPSVATASAAASAKDVDMERDFGNIEIVDPTAEEEQKEEARVERRRALRCKGMLAKLQPALETEATADVKVRHKALEDLGRTKRKKAPDTNKTMHKKAHEVPRNPDGTPVMPITVFKGLTVESLGTILTDRRKWHTRKYLWPLGYRSTRVYSSMVDPEGKATYVNEIVDGGEEPKFRITCLEKDDPVVIEASTSSGAWAEVGKRVNDCKAAIVGRKNFTQLSGPEMFGFSHPTIAKLIQELPGVNKLPLYEMQSFEPADATPSATPLPSQLPAPSTSSTTASSALPKKKPRKSFPDDTMATDDDA